MLTIYLVRHGETLFNVQKKIQGWCDSPLTTQGIAQATRLHDALCDVDFVHAYSSTSERCIDTANLIIGSRDIVLTSNKLFKEMNFGELEGECEQTLFQCENPMKHYTEGFRAIGGDTLEDVKQRMLAGIELIARNHPDGNVLLVSHGGSIMNLVQALEPERMEKAPMVHNCSLTTITYDGTFKIETFNQ